MRIIVGGMSHESNTLNPIITGEEDFVIFSGEDMLSKGMLPYYSSTGIIETLREAGCEVIPTVVARAVPNGVVSAELYNRVKADMMDRIRKAAEEGPVDGVCLGLHGSMKIEGIGCAEGKILSEIREILPDVPVTVALDMHATITEELMKNADALVGYKTAPHIDCRETGEHAARMLLESLRTGKKLVSSYCKVPVLIAGEKSESAAEPMTSLIEKCREMEKRPGIRAASFLLGFPWADDENNGVTALVSSLEDKKAADDAAEELAGGFWAERRNFKFKTEYCDSLSAVRTACDAVINDGVKPVFISDSGDNPTAGSTGDSTELFEHLISMADKIDGLPTPLLYSGFYAADACNACVKAGAGAVLTVEFGGRWDRINGHIQKLEVEVVKTVTGFGPYNSGLALVKYRNMLIVFTSKHIGFGDDELLPALDVKAEEYCIVVVKLGYLEACFREIAARAIMATSKGCSNEVLESIPFKKLPRPIFPLDPDMDYAPKAL